MAGQAFLCFVNVCFTLSKPSMQKRENKPGLGALLVIDNRVEQTIVPLPLSAEKVFPLSLLHCTPPSRGISGKGTTERLAPNPRRNHFLQHNHRPCSFEILYIFLPKSQPVILLHL
jgi:hypothetical protein